MRTVVSIHLSRSGRAAPFAGFRLPMQAPGGWRHVALGISTSPGSDAADGRTAALERLREESRAGEPLLVLLSGDPRAQGELVPALREASPEAARRVVLCVAGHDRPFWPAPPPGEPPVHGLILDSPPLAVEAACWQRVLGPGIGARVFVVPPEPLIPGPLALEPPGREASRDRGEGAFVIAQLGGAADSWQAIGVQAFQIWAHGCYGRCETCRALSLDRLLSPVARYEPRSACLYCGSGRLVRPGGRPEAQLAVTLLEEEVGAPDPRVVAEWLGASQQVSVVGAGDEPEARLRSALAEADVALLLGPTAFPGPWLDAARAAGLACVTNDAGGGESEASILIRSAHYTWDSRSHVTGRPALPQLIRALETAFSRRGELRRDAEPPAQRPEVAKAWGGALEALSQAPQRRRRLRRPRWAGGRWA